MNLSSAVFRLLQLAAIAMACLSAAILVAFVIDPTSPDAAARLYGPFFPYVERYAIMVRDLGAAVISAAWGAPLAVATMTAIHATIVSLGVLSVVDVIRSISVGPSVAIASQTVLGAVSRFATWVLQSVFLTVIGNTVWEFLRG